MLCHLKIHFTALKTYNMYTFLSRSILKFLKMFAVTMYGLEAVVILLLSPSPSRRKRFQSRCVLPFQNESASSAYFLSVLHFDSLGQEKGLLRYKYLDQVSE